MKTNLILIALMVLSTSMISQISKVNYGVKYNPNSCNFDCYMTAAEGATASDRDRIQFNSQLSLVVPHASQIFVEESYAPFVNNKNRNSDVAAKWSISNVAVQPTGLRDNDIYAISPKTTPTAFYNDIEVGEEVVLFSFSVEPMLNCGEGIRLFENGIDPASTQLGMLGRNFDNGMTIGGVDQLYGENYATVYPAAPKVEDVKILRNKNSVDVTFSTNSGEAQCQKELQYKWLDDQGNVLGNEIDFPNKSVNGLGEYVLEVSDALGCKTITEISISKNTASVSTGTTTTEIGTPSINTDVEGNNQVNPLELDDQAKEALMTVFPNPAKDYIKLDLDTKILVGRINVSISDANGKVVMNNVYNRTSKGDQSSEIMIPINLSTGIYNIGLDLNENRLLNKKVIVVE